MKHYYIDTGMFKIPLRQYLKQIGKLDKYDTVKRRFLRMEIESDGIVVISSNNSIFISMLTKNAKNSEINCAIVLASGE